jgi:hypothetical protein
MKKLLSLAVLLGLSASANATLICSQCEDNDLVGNYLGAFNPLTADRATFFHEGIGDRIFADFWVFDVLAPGGKGTAAANFVVETFLRLFRGQLWTDAGSQCAAGIGCLSVELGTLLADDFQVNRHWEIPFDLEPGRYVLRISGGTVPPKDGRYDGFLGFNPISIREAGTLGLFGLGLIGLGLVTRQRRA